MERTQLNVRDGGLRDKGELLGSQQVGRYRFYLLKGLAGSPPIWISESPNSLFLLKFKLV